VYWQKTFLNTDMMKSLVVFPDVVGLVKRVDFGVLTQKKRISTVRIKISSLGDARGGTITE
jgi:hypothetical protein